MLHNTPVIRSAGARTLFLVSAIITAALLQWQHHWRTGGDLHGLSLIFFVLFAREDYSASALALLILAGAALIPATAATRHVPRWMGAHPLIVAAIAGIVLCLGALFVYHDHPLSMDEYSVWFQSRAFATGHLTGRLPPGQLDWLIPPGFQNYFLDVSHTTGQALSGYWPGFALLLTPFTFAGIPWACNPVISALTLIVIHRLALEIFNSVEAAGLALLLTVASPVIFGLGVSYYSMPANLLANSLYALLLLRPTPRRAIMAGVVGSLALVVHSPLPHFLFCLPWLVWIATRENRWRLLGGLAAGYLPLCLLLGVGWFVFLQQVMHDNAATAPTLAASASGLGSPFTPPDITLLLARLTGIAKTWVWSVPGLLLLAIAGAMRARSHTFVVLFALCALALFCGYLLVPYDQGHGWGYRYFHPAWMALPLLATAVFYSPAGIPPATEPLTASATPPGLFSDSDTRHYLITCALLTLFLGIGFRAWQMQRFLAADIAQVPQYQGQERRVVIIDDRTSFYGGDLVQNDPFLRGNEIRMYRHSAEADARMMAQFYPDLHKVYEDRYGSVWSAAPVVETPRQPNEQP